MPELRVSLFDMCMCLSNAMDLVSPALVDHHKRVAYIASCISEEMGLSTKTQEDLIMAGILHDIGAMSLRDRLEALSFELSSPHSHTELGYGMINNFEAFADIAPIVRYHHLPWDEGRGLDFRGREVPVQSHILHLADRVAVLINPKYELLGQVESICKKILKNSGRKFSPEVVEVFLGLSDREAFWFDIESASISQILHKKIRASAIRLNLEELGNLANLFSRIIDFRSSFTATHSSGVAASAEALAGFVGMTRQKCSLMRIAGYLHDLGKLAIPSEILEKPGRLSKQERNIMRRHPYYTYRIIETVGGLDIIKTWASYHHECLDGNGYPFRLKSRDIPLGSRIIAVADIFTALTEDRPYRLGMSKDETLKVLLQMAGDSALDPDIMAIFRRNYDEINAARMNAQAEESAEYEKLK